MIATHGLCIALVNLRNLSPYLVFTAEVIWGVPFLLTLLLMGVELLDDIAANCG